MTTAFTLSTLFALLDTLSVKYFVNSFSISLKYLVCWVYRFVIVVVENIKFVGQHLHFGVVEIEEFCHVSEKLRIIWVGKSKNGRADIQQVQLEHGFEIEHFQNVSVLVRIQRSNVCYSFEFRYV